MIEFHKAFFAAQQEIQNPSKNKINPHFKSKYADLEAVIETVKGTLHKHGLTITQEALQEDGGLSVVTTVTHVELGQSKAFSTFVPIEKTTPQAGMAAFTYGRRYALLAIFCLAAEDDDGNSATNNKPESVAGVPKPVVTLTKSPLMKS
jgi:hypothetical protein